MLRRRSPAAGCRAQVSGISAAILLHLGGAVDAQQTDRINPALLTDYWTAQWIVHPTAPAHEYGVVHFRKTFELADVPAAFIVHVSGDNRYRLWVNDHFVALGPAAGDLRHWHFESVDLAAFLRPGRNVLAAIVWNGGEFRPMAQMTNRTAFLLQGDGELERLVDTDTSWRTFENRAFHSINYRQNDPRLHWDYYVAGVMDSVRADAYPWGWERPDYDDRGWLAARPITRGAPIGRESHQAWQLTPRRVPFLPETPQRFRRLARSEGGRLPAGFLRGTAPVTIPPNTLVTFLLDHGELTTGYPLLRLSGGAGAAVKLTYSEALYERERSKGHREAVEGQHVWGVYDVFVADGGERRAFRPLNVRTFRWVEMEVHTAGEPLVLEDLSSLYTAYPSTLEARFASDRDALRPIWDAGWRTLEISAQETFVSDLYWERMQYIGDTKVQAMAWMYMTRDDRLVRLALEQFDHSRAYFGLTQSRYPAFLEQYIPLYSLVWITMVHDYWMHRPDDGFLPQFLPGVRQVLGWFERKLNDEGMLELLFHLDFVDWSYMPRRDEILRGAGSKSMCVHTLFYAYTLERAAELFGHFGHDGDATAYRGRSRELTDRAYRRCYDVERGLFADTPDREHFSQHANVLAVLTGAVPAEEQRALLERTLAAELLEVDLYFEFFMGRALNKAGLGDRYLERLGPWENMLRLGMRTFGEVKGNPRSEAHAWSASPNYEFLATVLGIEPAAPGFAEVRIAPHPGALAPVGGTVPHPAGDVTVELRRGRNGALTAEVVLPPGLTGTFEWAGNRVPLSGHQRLELRPAAP
jgi:alpha-L-rhamnosidase